MVCCWTGDKPLSAQMTGWVKHGSLGLDEFKMTRIASGLTSGLVCPNVPFITSGSLCIAPLPTITLAIERTINSVALLRHSTTPHPWNWYEFENNHMENGVRKVETSLLKVVATKYEIIYFQTIWIFLSNCNAWWKGWVIFKTNYWECF